MLLGAASWAYDAKVDGIYYNLISKIKTAEVTNSTGDSSAESYSGSITIPSTIIVDGTEYTVTSIAKYAFYHCSRLTTVNIPSSVTSIGDYAFYNCI